MTRQIESSDGIGQQAAVAFGTPYLVPLRGKKGCKTVLDSFGYKAGTTAHTATVLREQGRTKIAATAAISQAVINLVADPGAALFIPNAIAIGDFLVIRRQADHVLVPAKVSSLSALAITLTANLTVPLAAGDDVWFYGVPGDTDPDNGLLFPQFAMTASTLVTVSNSNGNGVASSSKMDSPLLLHVDNITAAGTFFAATWFNAYEPGAPTSLLGGFHEEHVLQVAPEAAIGGAIAKLPWANIVGGLLNLFKGILGGTAAPAPAPTPGVPTTAPAAPAPWVNLVNQLAAWLAAVMPTAQQTTPPVPTVPTTTGS